MICFIGETFQKTDEYGDTIAIYLSNELGMNYNIIDESNLDMELIKSKVSKYTILISSIVDDSLEKELEIWCNQNHIFYVNIFFNSEDIISKSYEVLYEIRKNKVSDYNYLSTVYDQMQDRLEYSMYNNIINKYIEEGSFLELGAGSGNVTEILCNYNLDILATDLSPKFLDKLKKKKLKTKINKVETSIVDITKIKEYGFINKYDYVGMFLDTLNYINPKLIDEVFLNISKLLKAEGKFFFDIHKENKLEQFDGYIEELQFDDFKFHWMSLQETINSVSHNFTFINEKLYTEKHIQYILPIEYFRKIYTSYFLEVEVEELDDRYIIVLEKLK